MQNFDQFTSRVSSQKDQTQRYSTADIFVFSFRQNFFPFYRRLKLTASDSQNCIQNKQIKFLITAIFIG